MIAVKSGHVEQIFDQLYGYCRHVTLAEPRMV